jgi:DNA-binding NarL/FixJ family response regulator
LLRAAPLAMAVGNAAPMRLFVFAHSANERLLYARTLAQAFPQASIAEFGSTASALLAAQAAMPDAALVHFNNSPETVEVIASLRRQCPRLPILAISGVDRTSRALATGATRFMLAQDWRLLGQHISELVERPAQAD